MLATSTPDSFLTLPFSFVAGVQPRPKRKRKPVVIDEMKELDLRLMKKSLLDTSDIVRALDMAPPTKKLMMWAEMGGVMKLFTMPCRKLSSQINLQHCWRNEGRQRTPVTFKKYKGDWDVNVVAAHTNPETCKINLINGETQYFLSKKIQRNWKNT